MAFGAKYLLLSFPLASASLGVWQLQRLKWKKNLISDIEQRTSEKPVDIMQIASVKDLEDLEYHKAIAVGYYDTNPQNQVFIKPRTLVLNQEARSRGRSEQNVNTGVHVITPFNVANSNLRILVNRGWLPLKNYRGLAHHGIGKDGDEPIEIVGLIRKTEKAWGVSLKNDGTTDEWNYRDINGISKVLHTAPIFFDLVENCNINQGEVRPIAGQTRLSIRNEHLNYAITWFGLAVFTFMMWRTKFKPKVIPRRVD